MKSLTVREWLEQERLSGLPHADFAAEALADLDAYEQEDAPGAQAVSDLEDVEKHVTDFAGAGTVDRVEMAVKTLDNLIDIHGGDYSTIVERTEAADLRWWAIWDVPGMLRMFLPADV